MCGEALGSIYLRDWLLSCLPTGRLRKQKGTDAAKRAIAGGEYPIIYVT